jgi:hypothetical protein
MARKPKWFRAAFGVTEDGHLTRMGKSQSLFWWAVARQTPYPSPQAGWVLGGQEIRREDIAGDLQLSPRTISRLLDQQEELGYLERTLTSHGFRLRVLNQKKFGTPRSRLPKVAKDGETQLSMPDLARVDESGTPGAIPVNPVTCTSSSVPRSQQLVNTYVSGPSEESETPPPKKPVRKRPKKPKNPITESADKALAHFREIYPKVLGKPDGSTAPQYFVNWPRDRAILTPLVRGHGLEHVLERITAFWRLKYRMLRHQDQRYNVALNRIHGADNSIPGFKFVYDTLPTLWVFETDPKPWKEEEHA